MNIMPKNYKKQIKFYATILVSYLIILGIGSFYPNRFKQLIKYNSILAIEQFIIRALPLKDKIESRDESYFYSTNNYDKHFKTDEDYLDEIIRFQSIYDKLDNESKSNLWDIVQAMTYLAEEYLKKKLNIS